ncbi:MAG: DNA-binding protein [Planctomycetota bacterium]|nr:DNA-binding protein [Planctomycetota bacterium]
MTNVEVISSLGNRITLSNKKLALFCSVKCPGNLILQTYELAKALREKGITVIGGFHSPIEQEVLNILLKGTQPIIICPARSIENMRIPAAWKSALEQNRLLVLSPFAKGKSRMTEANAIRRNKFVADITDAVFIAYASPGGKTESFCRDLQRNNKPLFTFDTLKNQNLLALGAKPITSAITLQAYRDLNKLSSAK